MLVNGRVPGTAYLLPLLGAIVLVLELARALRTGSWAALPKVLLTCVAVPLALLWLTTGYAGEGTSLWLNMLLPLALIVPLGPIMYRIVYQPLAAASVLVLLVVSGAVTFALARLSPVFFGAVGRRSPA